VLLDRAEPGSGTTAASYAWVNANRKLPRAYFDLSVAAMEDYRRLAWRLAPAPWYHRDGNLIWFRDPARASALRENVQRLQAWGYAAELLPARVVLAELEPGLAIPDPETPVAWFSGEAWVDAPAMTRRLVEAARNAGGRVLMRLDREVVAIGREGDRISSVTLREGQTLPVAAAVNAAGPDASRVAAMVGRNLPMARRPGLAMARPVSALVDVRPIPTDGLPRVGEVLGIPGYIEAVTHSGVTLAPLIARSLTDEMLGEPGNPLLAPFRPDRFPIA
jgi:glycine/D-amino acid oxidase-like deaminating enzyme